jgi:phosphatidylserine/phosphatidylglycerophosphate/cardiolipin synthase-like enzyme
MLERGVAVDLFLDISARRDAERTVAQQYDRFLVDFLRRNWPFGAPVPNIYFDPRAFAASSWSSMHAKCIIVDARWTLITSANFTDRGQSRNIEAGVLIEDATFALEFRTHWERLTQFGVMKRAENL